jgi:hypothetical protein
VRYFLILFLTSYFCAGQSVAVGVLGGGRLTSDVTSSATPESRFYDVGAIVELGSFPHGLSVEVDALYHRQGFLGGAGGSIFAITQSERANSWEFPILVKYKLPLHTFALAGVAPRSITGRVTNYTSTLNQTTDQEVFSTSTSKTQWPGSLGIVAGGGVRLGIGRLLLTPQVRYTWWANMPINEFTMTEGQPLQSSRNQVDLLLGIGWKFR